MATILVVEDNPSIQSLLKIILAPEYRVVQAFDAAQGLELARCTEPDLVILNVNLGSRPDGLEVCRILRGALNPLLAQVPILIITGESTKETIRKALAAGATNYASKPFDLPALFTVIVTLVARKRVEAPLPCASGAGVSIR